MPDYPEPTSYGLKIKFYKDAADFADKISSILDIKVIDPYCDTVMPIYHIILGDCLKVHFNSYL